MKYKEWLHDWLELYEKESVKPRTYKQYEDVINKRLIPALGDYEMEDLSPIILQRYIVDLSQKGNTKTGKGLAPNSVNCIILVLHSSLSMAYVLGLSKEIHVDKIKRPKTSEKPVESFTKEEQKMIEQAVLADKRDMYLRRNPDQTREEAFSTQDFISDLEAKYNADDYYFEQELMDLFRPSVEHNQAWGARLFLELFLYAVMPESYTKTVHNMVLAEEEAERSLVQTNTSDAN